MEHCLSAGLRESHGVAGKKCLRQPQKLLDLGLFGRLKSYGITVNKRKDSNRKLE